MSLNGRSLKWTLCLNVLNCINALRGSVRPVITYCFFALFVAIKVTALLALLDTGHEIGRALSLIWDNHVILVWQ
jgi:hypothetical protein